MPHIYLAFRSQLDRDRFYANLLMQSELKLCEIEQDVMTLQWQNGFVSNYEYLLYINRWVKCKTKIVWLPIFISV